MRTGILFQDSAWYQRRQTREVNVGLLRIGGQNPISVQSMINTNLENYEDTVEQIKLLVKLKTQLVRIAVPNQQAFDHLLNILNILDEQHIRVPICADVHFSPTIAKKVAEVVDKVRINPGNFGEPQLNTISESSVDEDSDNSASVSAEEAAESIKKRLYPVLEILKKRERALRIGVNQASISKRIARKYKNPIRAMIESAIEYVTLCEEYEFYNLVISLKASSVINTVNAYRQLVKELDNRKMNYPLHLGITEAGFGFNGVMKSFSGIGSLLEDGIGDTIRISIAGNPAQEITYARDLVSRYNRKDYLPGRDIIMRALKWSREELHDYSIPERLSERRYARPLVIGKTHIGGDNPVQVELYMDPKKYPIAEYDNWRDDFLEIAPEIGKHGHIIQHSISNIREIDNIKKLMDDIKIYNIPISCRVSHNFGLAKKLIEVVQKINFVPSPTNIRSQWLLEIQQLIEEANSFNKILQIDLSQQMIPHYLEKDFGITAIGVIETIKLILPFVQERKFRGFVTGIEGKNIVPIARILVKILEDESINCPIVLKSLPPVYVTEKDRNADRESEMEKTTHPILEMIYSEHDNEIGEDTSIYESRQSNKSPDESASALSDDDSANNEADKNGENFSAHQDIISKIDDEITKDVDIRYEQIPVNNTVSMATLLIDRIGDIIELSGISDLRYQMKLAHSIFQSLNINRYFPDIIACPTCSRTTLDVEKHAENIQNHFLSQSHLSFAVMGCYVNGPGEVKETDYGVMGSKEGKVHLYKRTELVKKDVDEDDIIPELEKMVRDDNMWMQER